MSTAKMRCSCIVQRFGTKALYSTRKHWKWQLFVRGQNMKWALTRDYWLNSWSAWAEPIVYSCYPHAASTKLALPIHPVPVHTGSHLPWYYDFCTLETFLLTQLFLISVTVTSTKRYDFMSWFQSPVSTSKQQDPGQVSCPFKLLFENSSSRK